MNKKRKDFITVGSLLIITLLFIISIFSVPAILSMKDNFEISKYESTKASIINSAKSKFSANVSDIKDDEVVEYTVKDLIKEGYLKSDEINPLTGKKYNDDDKVLVISKNGEITYKFISGTTLLKEIRQSNDVKVLNNEFYYIGQNPSNYLVLNEKIYRILKIDNSNGIYIIPEKTNKKIKKNDINSYLESYINDNFDKNKSTILQAEVLTFNDYKNTKNNSDETYINNDNYFWINDNKDLKIYDSLNKIFLNVEKAWISPVLKIDNTLVVQKGNGSRINPYVVE